MEKKYHSFINIILYLRKFHYGDVDSRLVEEDMFKNDIKEAVSFMNID